MIEDLKNAQAAWKKLQIEQDVIYDNFIEKYKINDDDAWFFDFIANNFGTIENLQTRYDDSNSTNS